MKLLKKFIGDYVIVLYQGGVHFGKLMEYDPSTEHAILFECRRIKGWEGAYTLDGVANNPKACTELNLSVTNDRILLTNVVNIIPVQNARYIQNKNAYGETDKEEILDFIDKLRK